MASTRKTTLKPSTLLSPVPAVMVSCRGVSESLQQPNIITIAWAGTICSDPPMLSISIRPSRLSHTLIMESREFVVNVVGIPMLRHMDFCGVKSGREFDKFAACELTPTAMEGLLHAPAIEEAPMSLGCTVTQVLPLGTHDLFLAEICHVAVDPTLLDDSGKLCLDRAQLVAYRHGEYCALGEALGFFGYSVASPEVLARRMGGGTKA